MSTNTNPKITCDENFLEKQCSNCKLATTSRRFIPTVNVAIMNVESACTHKIEDLNAMLGDHTVLPPTGFTSKVLVSDICQHECGMCA